MKQGAGTNPIGECAVTAKNYTTSFTVHQTPDEVFKAVNNVRGWWSKQIDGDTDKLGAVFTFSDKTYHRSTHEITKFVPGKKVVWHTREASINFVKDKAEWNDTDTVFEIAKKGRKTELRFTHIGLIPSIECYGDCSGAWGYYINESLHDLITTGQGKAEAKERSRRTPVGAA
jgi:hypothetical protein